MRRSIILLILSLTMVTIASLPKATSQSSTTTAWNNLVQAFATVRTAESDGAPRDDIVRLSSELNIALAYYENATISAAHGHITAADNDSTLSINLSQSITSEATGLDQTARSQQTLRLELAYGTSFVLAVVSSIAIVESDRIRRALRKKRVPTIEGRAS